MPYVFLFVGMLCFGWSNCLWRPLQKQLTTAKLIFLRSIWTVPLIAMTGVLMGNVTDFNSLKIAITNIPYILLSLAGLWSFVSSMKYQQAGISGSIILYIGFFGTLVAWYFTGEKLPKHFSYTVILYITGLFLISPGMIRDRTPWRGRVLALIAALCWAFANLGMKQGIEQAGLWNLSLVQECTVLCASGLFYLGTRTPGVTESTTATGSGNPIQILPLALLTIGGVILCNASLGKIPVLHFALITVVQPVTTLFVSALIYKEQLSLRQWFGGILLMAGSVFCAIN